MKAFVFPGSFPGMVVPFLLASIGAGIEIKLILLGVSQQRDQPTRWSRQSLIMAGIAFLLMSVGQVLNLLIPVYARHFGLSLSTQTLLNAIANLSLFFPFAVILYLKIREVFSRRSPGDDEQADTELYYAMMQKSEESHE